MKTRLTRITHRTWKGWMLLQGVTWVCIKELLMIAQINTLPYWISPKQANLISGQSMALWGLKRTNYLISTRFKWEVITSLKDLEASWLTHTPIASRNCLTLLKTKWTPCRLFSLTKRIKQADLQISADILPTQWFRRNSKSNSMQGNWLIKKRGSRWSWMAMSGPSLFCTTGLLNQWVLLSSHSKVKPTELNFISWRKWVR